MTVKFMIFRRKRLAFIVLLFGLVLGQISKDAFARDHNVIGLIGRQNDLFILSPDGSTVVGQVVGGDSSFMIEASTKTHEGLGTSWTSAMDSYVQEGQMVGDSAPSRGFEGANIRVFYPHTVAFNLSYSYDLYYNIGSSLRFFWSGKANLHFDILQNKYILTHDPNRSASCATAVNDSYLNPNASLEPIKANCTIIRQPFFQLIGEYESGVNWYISDHWMTSMRFSHPYDYRVKGFVFHRDPVVRLIIGYNI